MITHIFKLFMIWMLALPLMVFASEQYDLTVTMPVSQAGGEVELKQMTFTTYYSQLETRVGAVTWDPCKANDQGSDCDLLNPLNTNKLNISLRAFNAEDIEHIDSCYIAFDFSNYKPLSNDFRFALGTDNPEAQLLQLTVQSIERNTRGSPYYADCEYRVLGLDQHSAFGEIKLPAYLHPVIPACHPPASAGRQQAIALNDEGMDYYRSRNWKQAARLFSQAAEQDCSYFIALTNLASVLALQEQFPQAQAVLWRAYKLDPVRTMKKLETDSDYHKLKHDTNFYSAASAIGMSYRHYCYAPAAPADANPELPGLIDKSKINKWNKRYAVATRYAFKSDFNKNGIADWVYPLVNARLESLLVVFDGNKLNAKACTSTPLQSSDLINANRADPCKTKIFAGAQASKRGIRLETEAFGVSRLVCD